jgi:alpha-galactosidase
MAKDQENHTDAALFNATDETAEVEVTLAQLGLSSKQRAINVWNQEELGEITDGITQMLPPHGSILIKLY